MSNFSYSSLSYPLRVRLRYAALTTLLFLSLMHHSSIVEAQPSAMATWDVQLGFQHGTPEWIDADEAKTAIAALAHYFHDENWDIILVRIRTHQSEVVRSDALCGARADAVKALFRENGIVERYELQIHSSISHASPASLSIELHRDPVADADSETAVIANE